MTWGLQVPVGLSPASETEIVRILLIRSLKYNHLAAACFRWNLVSATFPAVLMVQGHGFTIHPEMLSGQQ